MDDFNQENRVTVLVKAAPRVGRTHGETVCCAGIDPNAGWVRLFPVVFRTLDEVQKFARWDIISYRARSPKDVRFESRRVDHHSIRVVDRVRPSRRQELLARHLVESLDREHEAGRSLALIRPRNPVFFWTRKDQAAFDADADASQFMEWHRRETEGLFGSEGKRLSPYTPSRYRFGYRYRTADGDREGTCQDWEIEATFLRWEREYGEAGALQRLQQTFGVDYVNRGFVLAMGTHKAYPSQWLINGILRLAHHYEEQVSDLLV
jgi:hypothetical protein